MRAEFLESVEQLLKLGFNLAATPGTAEYYAQHGLKLLALQKPLGEEVMYCIL